MAMCRNPKLWIALAVAAAAIIALTGASAGAVLPLLLIVACPLSMLLMAGGMAGMARRGRGDTGDTGDADPGETARLREEIAELRQHAGR